jgi:pilus assembly protein FimV
VNKLHLKRLCLILCLLALPMMVQAASLGKLSVFSSLGEPLNAEIDVYPSSPEELDSLSATLASDAVYHDQGVERTSTQSAVQFSVLKKEDGSVVLKLGTTQAVTDPFLDMLIALSWKDGSVTREYTLLLDPSSQASVVVDNANADAPKSIVTKNSDLAGKDKQGDVLVKKGDSLAAIAKNLQTPGVDLNRLLIALYQENKQAFDGENINRLKAGAVLKVPDQAVLESISTQDAQKEIQMHAAEWLAYKNKLAGLVADKEATDQADNQVNSGKVTTKADEKQAPAESEAYDVVKLSKSEDGQAASADALKDDLAAKQNAMAEADEKAGALEAQIADMKQLLAIKNKSLADTQNNAAKTPEVVTLLDTINPTILKALAGVSALLLLIIWLRRRLVRAKPLPVNDAEDNHASAESSSLADEDDVPQLKSFDLSSISLDFEPVITPVEVEAKPEPIPDAFNGDFSNLLKMEPAPSVKKTQSPIKKAEASRVDFADVETKFELAIAYLDMRDKRGAKKLLNQVLKEGNEDQRVRAQALINQLK